MWWRSRDLTFTPRDTLILSGNSSFNGLFLDTTDDATPRRARVVCTEGDMWKRNELRLLTAIAAKWIPRAAGGQKTASNTDDRVAVGKSNLPAVLDLSLLREVFPGNETRVEQFLERFVEIGDQLVGEIKFLIDQRNAETLAETSHRLKSSALTSGAFALAEACGALEEASLDADWTRITKIRAQLTTELKRVKAALHRPSRSSSMSF
jgi:HPt (histidine-containing phosphotransfer) domain-containing protein